MATSLDDIRAEARRDDRRNELRRFWRRTALVVVGVVAAVALVLWTNWMVQRYFILSDDAARGEQFRQSVEATAPGTAAVRDSFVDSQCLIAAESFYGESIGSGNVAPNEKAFYHACSGAVLGGRGGGGGD